MKCAKCGHEVDPASPECPYCAAGAPPRHPEAEPQTPRVRCPKCGSTDLDTVRKVFDPGCGCIGLLLFGWIGLLLGLLGANDVEVVCRNCGARWSPGHRGGSCLLTLLAAIVGITALCVAAVRGLTGALFRGI